MRPTIDPFRSTGNFRLSFLCQVYVAYPSGEHSTLFSSIVAYNSGQAFFFFPAVKERPWTPTTMVTLFPLLYLFSRGVPSQFVNTVCASLATAE